VGPALTKEGKPWSESGHRKRGRYGGGGGGSSYLGPAPSYMTSVSVMSGTTTAGINAGNGKVVISW